MVYKYFLFTTLLTLFCSSIFAQSGFNFGMKASTLLGAIRIQYQNGTVTKNEDGRQSGGTVNMAFSVPLKGKFRLGGELGINSFTNYLDYNIRLNSTLGVDYLGTYRINQAYFAIVPEFRPTRWAYINAGGGYYGDFNSHFIDGTRQLDGSSREDLTGFELERGQMAGFFVGIGIMPNMTKQLALQLDIRYTSCPPINSNPDRIGTGYNAIGFGLGLVYKPQE
jgi:hypothetical protein